MTEYNIKVNSWIELNFKDAIQKISINQNKVKQKEYSEAGFLPIIDQGSKFVGGYTNNLSNKVDCELPVVVFGDHTKIVKFVNFDFAPGADGIKVIKPIKYFDPKLFSFFLRVLITKIPDRGYARHFQHLEKIKIQLPSLPEQHQIVSKIEELFSELDNGIENLKKARAQLKTYRQAVLKYAFEGKLTEQWRAEQIKKGNPPEPAEKLLERIKKEREKHYQQQVEDWKKACEQAGAEGKKKPAKPKKPKDLPPLTEKELAVLPELPEGWRWCKLGYLSYLITKGASPKWQGFEYVDDPCQVLFITSENIRNNFIDIDCPKYLENAFSMKQKNSILKKGDILFNIVGASIGRAAIYNLNFNANINQAVSLIRLAYLDLKSFLSIFLNTSFANEYYSSKKVDFARANLSLTEVSNIPIPLCSEKELILITSEIETPLSVCDKLEQTIGDSLKKSEALRQSILKKAFSGELTRSWREKHPELVTGEHSAQKLLERIKAEKAKAEAELKKTRSTRSKKKNSK